MKLRVCFVILAGAIAFAGCSSSIPGKHGAPAQLGMPQSTSPALIPYAPMAKKAIQPASAMDVKPFQATQQPNWTQGSGSSIQVVAGPGGSLCALSTQPAGPDKYI